MQKKNIRGKFTGTQNMAFLMATLKISKLNYIFEEQCENMCVIRKLMQLIFYGIN